LVEPKVEMMAGQKDLCWVAKKVRMMVEMTVDKRVVMRVVMRA